MQGIRGLFVPGPTNVPEAVRAAISIPMEDHRAPDLPAFIAPLLQDLKKVFRTEKGRVMIFPGSGTGGWEAALANCLSPGDKVLSSRFGMFSHLWVEMCKQHHLEVETADVAWGGGLPVETIAERLAADKQHKIKAVLACHNETATGVTSNIAGVRRALDETGHPALLFVDGVSSIASIDFRMDEWGVDVAVSGSQKGFMLPAGLAIVGISEKAMAAGEKAALPRSYFDFRAMAKANDELGSFPYTPPVAVIRGLRVSVDRLLAEGMENVYRRHNYYAEGVRRAVSAWGLKLCAEQPGLYSDTVSAICLPSGFDSGDLLKHAYFRYNVSLGAGLGDVAGKVFRIGHMGELNEIMIMMALSGAEMTMRDMQVPVEAGSGVAAAEEYYRSQPKGHRS